MRDMKIKLFVFKVLFCCLLASSCEKETLTFNKGDLRIDIQTGDHWLHDYPLFLGLKKKNPPQFAIWLEDTDGNYVSTLFVTYKIATEGWVGNNDNRRKEALPHWCHQRGVIYDDGLLLPTKDEPLVDGITGATPKENKSLQARLNDFSEPLIVKAEFNHSVDFNSFFPENAEEGTSNYSGGSEGSGQPAVVYSAIIHPGDTSVELRLIGYSSPDGSDGNIRTDLTKLTTAKSIVKEITVQRL
jgi:hypothetical protein